MDKFLEFVRIVVSFDAIAIAVALGVGAVIAPLIILVRGACWWKRRLKWAAVAVLTSWLGLWLFWREQARVSAGPPNSTVIPPG